MVISIVILVSHSFTTDQLQNSTGAILVFKDVWFEEPVVKGVCQIRRGWPEDIQDGNEIYTVYIYIYTYKS